MYPSNAQVGVGRKVLLADDNPRFRRRVRAQLEAAGYQVIEATSRDHALESLREDIAAVVVDPNLSGAPGMDVLRNARTRFPETPVILLCARDGNPEAIDATRFDAYPYLAKSSPGAEVLGIVRHALHTAVLEDDYRSAQAAERPKLAGYTMEQIERWALADTLESVGGNKAAAARILGVCEKTIYNKLRRMNLQERHG